MVGGTERGVRRRRCQCILGNLMQDTARHHHTDHLQQNTRALCNGSETVWGSDTTRAAGVLLFGF